MGMYIPQGKEAFVGFCFACLHLPPTPGDKALAESVSLSQRNAGMCFLWDMG